MDGPDLSRGILAALTPIAGTVLSAVVLMAVAHA